MLRALRMLRKTLVTLIFQVLFINKRMIKWISVKLITISSWRLKNSLYLLRRALFLLKRKKEHIRIWVGSILTLKNGTSKTVPISKLNCLLGGSLTPWISQQHALLFYLSSHHRLQLQCSVRHFLFILFRPFPLYFQQNSDSRLSLLSFALRTL